MAHPLFYGKRQPLCIVSIEYSHDGGGLKYRILQLYPSSSLSESSERWWRPQAWPWRLVAISTLNLWGQKPQHPSKNPDYWGYFGIFWLIRAYSVHLCIYEVSMHGATDFQLWGWRPHSRFLTGRHTSCSYSSDTAHSLCLFLPGGLP